MTATGKRTIQWAIAVVLVLVAAAIPLLVFWPVPVVEFPDEPPTRVGDAHVNPRATLTWVRNGTTCFPDREVVVIAWVETTLEDGSEFKYLDEGPWLNRRGACVEDNLVRFALPDNFTVPGPFQVRFDFCTNPGSLLRQACSTVYSPHYVLRDTYTEEQL